MPNRKLPTNKKVVDLYNQGLSSTEIAKLYNLSNNSPVNKIIKTYGITRPRQKLTNNTKQKMSLARKKIVESENWVSPRKGETMSRTDIYKNMAAHLRYDVDEIWLSQFADIDKLKTLNRAITRKERYAFSTEKYKEYIKKFYYCNKFNAVYEKWVKSGKTDRYLKPTVDHIYPKSKGGNDGLDNLQFLSWFENRSKNDMDQDAWDKLKSNIGEYLSNV